MDATAPHGRFRSLLLRQRSLCARVLVSWTMAGGITAGGFLLALATLGDAKNAGTALPAAPLLFGMGATAGLFHGALLAYLGRPERLLRRTALETLLMSLASLVVGLPVAAVIAGWIALGSVTLAFESAVPARVAIGAAILGAVICAWAVVEGAKALRNAFRRWPDARAGTLVLSGVLATLLVLFHRVRPEIWFTNVRVTGTGATLLAFVATLWIAAPVVILVMGLLRAGRPGETSS